jgi:hypothetical protein
MKSILLKTGFACSRNFFALALAALAGGAWLSSPVAAQAGALTVPSYSFETPDASMVEAYPGFTYWEKNPQPTNYDDSAGPWDYTMGVFYNFPGDTHIDNCDGQQVSFIYENPGAGIFQDYNSQDEMQAGPSHAFNYTYKATNAYTLTVAVLGYTGDNAPLSTNATISLSLYYRDSSNNMVTLGSTTVTNTVANFPTHTHFLDFQVQLPAVRTNDAWAGQNIGIALNSSLTDTNGGYWDVDNVRLVETPTPALQNVALTNGQIGFTLLSQPGLIYNIQTTTNVATAGSNWVSLATVTNTTGFLQFVDTNTAAGAKFYRAQPQP